MDPSSNSQHQHCNKHDNEEREISIVSFGFEGSLIISISLLRDDRVAYHPAASLARFFNDGTLRLYSIPSARRFWPETLTHLDAIGTSLGDSGIVRLCKSCAEQRNLVSLNLSMDRTITDAGWALALPFLSNTIETLSISRCLIADQGSIELANLITSGTLTQLRFVAQQFVTITGWLALVEAVRTCSLRLLDLSHNQVGSETVALLAQALVNNTTLNELNLDGNCASNWAAFALADVLHRTNLTRLSLSHNLISAPGAKRLLGAISQSPNIVSMPIKQSNDLDFQDITHQASENKKIARQFALEHLKKLLISIHTDLVDHEVVQIIDALSCF